VVLAGGEFPQEINAVLLREFAWAGLFVEVLTGVVGIAPHRTVVRSPGGSLIVVIDPIQQRTQSFLAKRTIDVAVSGLALVVLSPLLLLTAVMIKATSPGPVTFRQPRIGRNGRVFDCLKFRSMVIDAENHPFKQDRVERLGGMGEKTADDPRVTAVGRFIRKTSIDELPQLINVLRGDMSLVGPRPLALDDALVGSWSKLLPYRHRVRPGITCTWQVSGRSRLTTSERLDLDLYYVDNWSSWLDTEVAVRTVPAVVKADGAC
jgi:lipopolysaccharide/colanic/teichoic acid biosynthesis glycosyltransferase